MHLSWQGIPNVRRVLRIACLFLLVFVLMPCTGILMPLQVLGKTENTEDAAPGRKMARQAITGKRLWITSDHSMHEILKQEFTSGPEVTKACISCHNQAALQFHETIHWTWMDPITEKSAKLGKGGLSINNF